MERVQESLARASALLSVIGEGGIELHGTSEFETNGNNMKISPVLGKLEGYYMQRLTRCIKLTSFSYKTNKSVNQSITT